MLVALYLFILVSYFSGKRRGTGLKVTVSVQDKRGSRTQYYGETDRLFDFKKWHNITVRFQDAQSLIRIFVDDKMIAVKEFKGFDIFPWWRWTSTGSSLRSRRGRSWWYQEQIHSKSFSREKNVPQREILDSLTRGSKRCDNSPFNFDAHYTMLSLELLLASGV